MRFGSPLVGASVGGSVVAVCADSVYVVFLIGSLRVCGVDPDGRRLVLGLLNRVGWCDARVIGLAAIGSRGGLGEAGFSGEGYTLARITPAGGVGAWRIGATHRFLQTTMLGDVSWERSRATAFEVVTGPSVVRLNATDNLPVATSVQSRLNAAVGCDRLTVPVSGASCRGPKVRGSKRSTMGIVEEWRSIATRELIRR